MPRRVTSSWLLISSGLQRRSKLLLIGKSFDEIFDILRSGDESIKICAGQGVNQEQFLTLIRMDIMSVLLKLIEPNSATPEKLQEIGKELLAVRSKINAEITRIIMLREAKSIPQTRTSECDCGIFKEISDGLQEVSEGAKGYQKVEIKLQ